jgi:hypothetical protein
MGPLAGPAEDEARAMFLALIEVLVDETTKGVAPESVRDLVSKTIDPFVPKAVRERGGFFAAQTFLDLAGGQSAESELRSQVLGSNELQVFLRSSVPFQDFLTGVYRMNKAGRLGKSTTQAGRGLDETASALRHTRILEAAIDDASCLFLHLRVCPALFLQPPDAAE